MRMNNKAVACFFGLLTMCFGWLRPASGVAAEKSVTWLLSGPLTGPGAAAVLPLAEGITDFTKELNGKGGANGVELRFVAVDDRYDVARGISTYQRYRKEPRLICVNAQSTGLTKALLPIISKDKVVVFTPGAGLYQAQRGYVFLTSAPYQDGFGAGLDWMVKDWQGKGNKGTPVVGYLGWDNPAGKEPLNGGKEYAEKLGVKLLPPEFYPPGSLKHDTWLTRIAEQGAQYLYIEGVDPSHTNVIRDAHALGLTQKITMVSDFWGPISTIGVKTHPKELEGTYVVSPFIRGTERLKHPSAQLWTKYQKGPLEDMNDFYLMGAAMGSIVTEALKGALDEVGYEKVDGDAFFKGLLKLNGKDVTNGLIGKLNYGPDSRRGSDQVKVYQVKGGALVPVTDWITAPDCVSLAKY